MKMRTAVILLALAFAGYGWKIHADAERQRELEEARRANAVLMMQPAYRLQLWKQLETAVSRYILVQGSYVGWKDAVTHGVALFPRNQLSFSCDAMLGITIDAGQGDQVPEIALVGPLALDDDLRPMDFGPGVGNESPAVQSVLSEICLSLASRFGERR